MFDHLVFVFLIVTKCFVYFKFCATEFLTGQLTTHNNTQREAMARQNPAKRESDRVCLEFSLVTFFQEKESDKSYTRKYFYVPSYLVLSNGVTAPGELLQEFL
jgi:hypothetical protein